LRAGVSMCASRCKTGRLGPLKDDEPRIVPILKSLAPIVTAWRLKTGGEGLLFKPANLARGGRPDLGTASTFIGPTPCTSTWRRPSRIAACPR